MKKLLLFAVLVMAALLQTGCVKQKQCELEGGQAGYFIYLQEPFMARTVNNSPGIEIKAFFVPDAPDLDIESLTERLLNDPDPLLYYRHHGYYIYGNIPNSFKKNANTPVKVICAVVNTYVNYFHYSEYMKRISCLERID